MEEPLFPFFSEGDEHDREHCYDCGMPLPDEGDPDVIYVVAQDRSGEWQRQPACRRHWKDATVAAESPAERPSQPRGTSPPADASG